MKKIAFLIVCLLAVPAAVRAADASEIFGSKCAGCHGADGKGGSKAGHMVGVKNMTDAAYQKTFTDEEAIARVTNGYKKMKPFKEKLSGDEIKALVAYVRTLSAK